MYHRFYGRERTYFEKMVKLVQSEKGVLTALRNQGTTTQVSSEQTTASLKQYVCQHYGEKRTNSGHVACRKIFRRNFSRDSEMADLSLRPPCIVSL